MLEKHDKDVCWVDGGSSKKCVSFQYKDFINKMLLYRYIFLLFQHYPIPALEDKHWFFLTPSLPDSASLSYSLPSYIFFSFICSFSCSLTRVFVRLFIRSFFRACVRSHSFFRSFIHLSGVSQES